MSKFVDLDGSVLEASRCPSPPYRRSSSPNGCGNPPVEDGESRDFVEHALDMLNIATNPNFPMSCESKLAVLRGLLTPSVLSALGKFQQYLDELYEAEVEKVEAIAQSEAER